MSTSVQSIRVAICGASGSGKTKLSEQLDGYTFTRPRDNKSFRLTVQEIESESIIFPDYEFALFTFSLQNDPGLEIDQKWRAIKASIWERYPLYFSKMCLVGTKLDLVTLREHACVRSLRATIAFWVKVKYISTSSITKAGLDEVATFIADQLYPLPVADTCSRGLFERLGDKILDVVASIFALPVPKNINQDTPDPLELVDDDAVEPLWTSPEAKAFNQHLSQLNTGAFFTSSAYRISPTLLAKSRKPVEWANTTFARSHLNIPIPQSRYHHLNFWFIQDFVQGKTLKECWSSLSFFMQFRVACTLRGYISQMRRLTRAFPGSVEGGAIMGFNFDLDMYNGPYGSSLRFQQWLEEVAYYGWRCHFQNYLSGIEDGRIERGEPSPNEPVFTDIIEDLVFTHGDISPSNLVLSNDGVLWMIDWCDSGYYPTWAEPLAIHRYTKEAQSWNHLRWLFAGPRPAQYHFWNYIADYSRNYSSPEPRAEEWP
ncbi:hypothetical protein GALMADRAFT_242017 [Galerina marginata CBS 339.88]|uniref:Aminoglycoside phosphotransferase domain-containing protein n=1 Tax=Galerina marginata (strain CBS 339.88) TaxID=685588 RepID=A0A067TLS9_GALM3|nr:hypothetical protein GALMADRAFT_242017 [Galerina marginata CBS 339.88]